MFDHETGFKPLAGIDNETLITALWAVTYEKPASDQKLTAASLAHLQELLPHLQDPKSKYKIMRYLVQHTPDKDLADRLTREMLALVETLDVATRLAAYVAVSDTYRFQTRATELLDDMDRKTEALFASIPYEKLDIEYLAMINEGLFPFLGTFLEDRMKDILKHPESANPATVNRYMRLAARMVENPATDVAVTIRLRALLAKLIGFELVMTGKSKEKPAAIRKAPAQKASSSKGDTVRWKDIAKPDRQDLPSREKTVKWNDLAGPEKD